MNKADKPVENREEKEPENDKSESKDPIPVPDKEKAPEIEAPNNNDASDGEAPSTAGSEDQAQKNIENSKSKEFVDGGSSRGSSHTIVASEARLLPAPLLQVGKEIYPEKLLECAEGGYNDFLPAWAFPWVKIQAVVTLKDNSGRGNAHVKEQKIVLQDTIDAMNKNMVKAVLSQFERLTISKIHHLAQLGEFATILFREKKLVDILLHVLDKTYYAHKHVLCCHSEFFTTLLVAHHRPPDIITDVTLSNVHPKYFQDFLHFCYYGEVELNEKNIPPLLNLCNKLNAPIMRAQIHMFIAANGELHADLVKKILTSKVKADRPLAIIEAIEKFEELSEDVQFLGRLSFEDIMEILSSDDLNINSELDVFWSALIWVADDVRDRFHNIDMLLQTVRVTCMSTLEIMDICRATSLIRLSKHCQQLIMNATWVCHAREMGLNDPLSLPTQTPRKRLIGKPPHQPTSAEFNKRYQQYKAVIGDDDKEENILALDKTGKRGRVVFADEMGANLEHVYVAETRTEDSKKRYEEEQQQIQAQVQVQEDMEKNETGEEEVEATDESKKTNETKTENEAKLKKEPKGKDDIKDDTKKKKKKEKKKDKPKKALDLWQGDKSDNHNAAVMSPTH